MTPESKAHSGAFFAAATNPERMRAVVAQHLRVPGAAPLEVAACSVEFSRRGPPRSLFQYRLTLRDPASGAEWLQVVSGVAYGGQRTRRLWEELQPELPASAAGAAWLPAAYVPELGLLLQVFPFDLQLPAVASLLAGPLPELVPPLLARFGSGDWRLVDWDATSVRYRVDLRATVRLMVRARETATGGETARCFFAKVYSSTREAERAWDRQRSVAAALAAADTPLAVAPIAAYLPDQRVVVQDEVHGESLADVLHTADADGAVTAVRCTARAVAALHCLAVAAPKRRSKLGRTDPIRLRRSADALRAARPDLTSAVAEVETGVLARLAAVGESPSVPIHGDLKPLHVMFDGDRVILLDFDKFGAGEPMLDVTSMLIPFRRKRPTRSGERSLTLPRALVEEYFAHVPAGWKQRLAPHYAWALLAEASAFSESVRTSLTKSRSGRHANRDSYVDVLVEEAQAVLAGRSWWEDQQLDRIHGTGDSPTARAHPVPNG